ncbi:TonB-dependent receptor [Arcobacter sp. CECT 8983]|uniref:TonB-dependent receptor plug domain-containing protein n=1 Tax=Arcobacter sp. CECT 8983 TaxID=2044508 RepID=UPI00100C1038|nr:TonB-dependent receptor plug domain-containing protein [Arcobacter sp. CECT 8983]RXJ88735.1 TonB-dependent receptor [Arcobacter sp. CECT 8983]
MKVFLFVIFLTTLVFSQKLDFLLKEYESSSKNSLETLNEKMGYVIVYTKEELEFMQYNNLSDVLKDIPSSNSNINRFGLNTISLSGSKTDVTGFFRLYINDHEVSSIYNQSPSLTWLQMPVSMIDHIEVYYGEGSFTLGNETGVQFIRVYTKSAQRENGSEIQTVQSNKNTNTQSFTHSAILENGWSYLLHFTNNNNDSYKNFNNNQLKNNLNSQYFFINLNSQRINIDMGYSKIKKDIYTGYSSDFTPDDGELKSDNFFINASTSFLRDNSLKATLSYDINNFRYEEENDNGLFIVPNVDLTNPFLSTNYFKEDIKLEKINASLSKKFRLGKHEIFTAISLKDKKYTVKERETNLNKNIGKYNDYDEEKIYSFMFQEDYELFDNLHLIGNYKIDKYNREGYSVDDKTESLYRVGAIYLPTDYLGFKSFYTSSYTPPTFYNIDFKDKKLSTIKTQKYKYFNIEGVLTLGDSKFNIDYHKVKVDDFAYLTPVGFINIEDQIKTSGLIFEYEYKFDKNNKLKLNYFTSNLNRNYTNSNRGGYAKYLGKYQNIDYFTSLVYKNSYEYLGVEVDDSYNLNLGFTYHHTKNLSFSLKGENLLNEPTASLFSASSFSLRGLNSENIALNDYERKVSFAIRWLF